MARTIVHIGAVALTCLVLCGEACAQWIVTELHPGQAAVSRANGTSGTMQFGASPLRNACMWADSSSSWISLGTWQSEVLGACQDQAAGYRTIGGTSHAVYWQLPDMILVDLNPNEQTGSIAYNTDGLQQVGYHGSIRACVWNGSAGTLSNLHPAWAADSIALGVFGGVQVGRIGTGMGSDGLRACMWTGSAATYVDLHPAGAIASVAYAADEGLQAGYVRLAGPLAQTVACLWRGNSTSVVNLNPAEAASSIAYGAGNGFQCGYAIVDGVKRAALWQGTTESWVDLSSVLPQGYIYSEARDVWSDGVRVVVVGHGYNGNPGHGRDEALLWEYTPIVSCDADMNCDGSVDQGDVAAAIFAIAGDDASVCRSADVNEDGSIDQGDLAFVIELVAGAPCP